MVMSSSSSVCVSGSQSTMELQCMLLLLLLLRVEADNLTEVKVVLGHSVTITCSMNISDLYWFIQLHGNLSVFIGRTFSYRQQHSSSSPSDRSKFLLQENNLSISQVSADDCRLYYCAQKINGNISYLHTFHLLTGKETPAQVALPGISTGTNTTSLSMTTFYYW